MQLTLRVFCIALTLVSCSKYQYLKISSDGTQPFQTNQFVRENDTYRVLYSFTDNASVTILNKSGRRVVIDWEKSFIIRNADGFRQPLSRRVIEVIPAYQNTGSEEIKFHGKKFFKVRGDNKIKDHVARTGSAGKIKRTSFDSSNSPLSCSVSLSFWIDGEPLVDEQSFYVSELINSRIAPENMPDGDQGAIVLKRRTVSSAIFGTVAVVALVLLSAYLSSQSN